MDQEKPPFDGDAPTGKIVDLASTGRFSMDATGQYRAHPTGKFRRVKRTQRSEEDDLSHPTQKIILFPAEVSQSIPNDVSLQRKKPEKKPEKSPQEQSPLAFTAPLPRVADLPKDLFDEGELEELYDNRFDGPDFSKYLQGEEDDEFAEFASEDSKLASIMKELEKKADLYADNMFKEAEEEDWGQIERLERLIPGTDQEDGKRIAPSREKIKVPRFKPLPPDVPPKELGRKLHKGHKFRKFRRKSLFTLGICASVLSFAPLEFSGQYLWFSQYQNQVFLLWMMLGLGFLLCGDLLWKGLIRSFGLKVGMDTLALFSGIFCSLDCALQYSTTTHRGQFPYVALVLCQFAFLLYGDEEKRKANLCGCQVANLVEEPYLVSCEPRKWNGKATYSKSSAQATDFTSQLQQEDGAQKIFAFTAPLFLLLGLYLAMKLTRDSADFVWALSAFFVASAPFAGGFIYGRPAYKVAFRLKDLYCALAGWTGVEASAGQVILSDKDLFPVGDVRITGTQISPGFSEKKILAYTAALLEEGDVGCSKLFQDMMFSRGQKNPRCREVTYHDGGGISARLGMDHVMVGGAAFMELMNVSIPEATFVNNGIFCSINGRLGGFFILEYSLNQMVNHSLDSLVYERIRPILATRDFALTPEILQRRFRLNTLRMDYPSVLRRYQLSSKERPENAVLTGILTREGLASLSDCIIGAKRLRNSVYQGVGLCLLASVLGFTLVAYLVASQAYNALSPDNLMIFMLLWWAPAWILTDLPQRF